MRRFQLGLLACFKLGDLHLSDSYCTSPDGRSCSNSTAHATACAAASLRLSAATHSLNLVTSSSWLPAACTDTIRSSCPTASTLFGESGPPAATDTCFPAMASATSPPVTDA